MLVLAGSRGLSRVRSSHTERVAALRNSLKDEGVIAMDEKELVFRKDYLFTSPSAAGLLLSGGADNGRTNWRSADGLSINDLELRALAEADAEAGDEDGDN